MLKKEDMTQQLHITENIYKTKINIPSGCFMPGVIARKKSSGVMKTSVVSPILNLTVAKYLNILSGVEYDLILFSYSIICGEQNNIQM